jgi:hypothetical protein
MDAGRRAFQRLDSLKSHRFKGLTEKLRVVSADFLRYASIQSGKRFPNLLTV